MLCLASWCSAKPGYRGGATHDRPWAQRGPKRRTEKSAAEQLLDVQKGWRVCIKPGLKTLKNGIPSPNFLQSEMAHQHGTVIKTIGARRQAGITTDLGTDFLVEFPDGQRLWLSPQECSVISRGEPRQTAVTGNGYATSRADLDGPHPSPRTQPLSTAQES